MQEILNIFQNWSGLIGMIIAGIILLSRKSDKLETLESSIKDLVNEIKNLVSSVNDNKIVVVEIKGEIKSLNQRVSSLERK